MAAADPVEKLITVNTAAQARDVYVRRLAAYPDWPELAEIAECAPCEVPPTARPTENAEEAA
jgi:hypothetical protein